MSHSVTLYAQRIHRLGSQRRPFETLERDKSGLKLAVSRTFKYSPLLPEKTHTVAVVPKNGSPFEWRYKHDVCIIDLRILLDDA